MVGGKLHKVWKLSQIPAITHVDDSARIQTVHKETNPRYYDLIRHFEARTGCVVLMFETTRDLIKDLSGFLKERQKYFLIPLIVTLLLMGILIVFA